MVSILGSPVTKPCSGWGIHEKVTASLCDVLLNLNRPADSRERMKALLMGLQNSICSGLEALDGEGRFAEESWVRPEGVVAARG